MQMKCKDKQLENFIVQTQRTAKL